MQSMGDGTRCRCACQVCQVSEGQVQHIGDSMVTPLHPCQSLIQASLMKVSLMLSLLKLSVSAGR